MLFSQGISTPRECSIHVKVTVAEDRDTAFPPPSPLPPPLPLTHSVNPTDVALAAENGSPTPVTPAWNLSEEGASGVGKLSVSVTDEGAGKNGYRYRTEGDRHGKWPGN